MTGGLGAKESIQTCYQNDSVERGYNAMLRLYAGGILEASRVLRKGGYIVVKAQDDSTNFTHIDVMTILSLFGFKVEDIALVVQLGTPAMRHNFQKHLRKNHSHFIIARFKS
jgi:hypothetical protein